MPQPVISLTFISNYIPPMRYLFFLLCLFSFTVNAQYTQKIVATPLNSFARKSSVAWAVYAKDTVGFYNPDLPALLISDLRNGKLKGFIPVEYGIEEERKFSPLSAKAIDSFFISPLLDYDAQGIAKIDADTKYSENNLAKEFAASPMALYQILYSSDGKLFSYISRVSVTKQIITPSGINYGNAELLSFAINKNYHYSSKEKNLVYLGQTMRTYLVDSFPKHDRLKETFGKNPTETLWPYVLSGKIAAYPVTGGERILPSDIDSAVIKEFIYVPVYDSTGNLISTNRIVPEADPSTFNKIMLLQKWYYDKKKNIVICKIPELTVYKNDEALLRLVF